MTFPLVDVKRNYQEIGPKLSAQFNALKLYQHNLGQWDYGSLGYNTTPINEYTILKEPIKSDHVTKSRAL